jgi:hypothetical protein
MAWNTTLGVAKPYSGAQPAPQPPPGDCCLFRVEKNARGRIDDAFGKPYMCAGEATAKGKGKLELKLQSAGKPCDEMVKLIPNGSELLAELVVFRRADDLAELSGKFEIINPAKKPLFVGTIELINRIDNNHAPFGKDACNPRDRMQGWLTGTGENDAKGFALRALLTFRVDPISGPKGYVIPEGSLDGIFVECR